MSGNDEEIKNALTTLGVGPAAKELYVDLLRPTAVEIGKNVFNVARLISHVLTPLEGVVWGLDRIRDWLKVALLRRLSKVDPEQIQTPPINVAGQILLQLPFCAEQERLREMYANLLAAAMTKDRAAEVHPAFVHVIQQLTPDEAVILQSVAAESFSLSESTDEEGRHHGASISIRFNAFCDRAGVVASKALTDAYLDNLLRLKILADQNWSTGQLRASRNYEFGEVSAFVETEVSRLIELSAFGERFVATCVKEVSTSTAAKSGG